MKTKSVLASLVFAASVPTAIIAQIAEFSPSSAFIAFIGGYTVVGLLAIAVSEYSRKAHRMVPRVHASNATSASAAAAPSTAWAYQTVSA